VRSLPWLVTLTGCGRIAFDATSDVGAAEMIAPTQFTLVATGADMELEDVAVASDGSAVTAGFITGAISIAGQALPFAGDHDVVVVAVRPDGSLRWARTFGGTGYEIADGVAIAADNTVYVVGTMASPVDFGTGTLQNQNADGFIAAFTLDGQPLWSRTVGGAAVDTADGSDFVRRVAIAPDGDLVIAGNVKGSVDFGDGIMTPGSPAAYDAFVAKLPPDGTVPRWTHRYGTLNYNNARALAIASNGDVYAAGIYEGMPDFGSGAVPYRGIQDVFLISYDVAGSLHWVRTFGGPGFDWPWGIAIAGDRVVVGGHYESTSDVGLPPSLGLRDGFLVGYDAAGTVQWTKQLGTPGCDSVEGVREGGGNVVIAERFEGTLDLGDGPLVAQGRDGVIAAFTKDGTLLGHRVYGGPLDDAVRAIAPTLDGGLYAVGYTDGPPTTCLDEGQGKGMIDRR
jgi:hypothetical protein